MSSACGENLIKKLHSISSFSEIEKELPFILTFLNENIHYFSQSSEVILKIIFKEFSSSVIPINILQPILLFFKKIFCISISDIGNLLPKDCYQENKNIVNISELLQICLSVLDAYSHLIDYFIKLGRTELQKVKNVMETLPSILWEGINHCRASEGLYGIYFLSCTKFLTSLFRKCYELSNTFYKWIDDCISLNYELEDDIIIMIKALQTLYSVGEIVVCLDTKTLVEQWKGLIKITNKYANVLKNRLDISHPLKFLVSSLQESITATMSQEDQQTNDKLKVRKLKLSSFVLKGIVKLCETYKGYLSGCEDFLLNLLLLLNRCSRLNRKNDATELERFVVVGAAPLLSHLLGDRPFIERFISYSQMIQSLSSEEAIGFLFTHLRLLRLLLSCSNEEILERWLNIPLVSNIIALFSKSFYLLDLNIKIEDYDTYTTIISIVAAYMAFSFSTERFVEAERLLFEQLLSYNIVTGIFVSDLLCLLARLTNEEVCLMETKFLCEILCSGDWHGIHRPEVCIAGLTAGRLFKFLSRNGQEIIEKQFKPHLHPYLWLYLNSELIESLDLAYSHMLLNENQNVSSEGYLNLMELFALCKISDVEVCDNLNSAIQQLWNGFGAYDVCKERQPDWWYYIFFLFTKSMPRRIEKMDSIFIKEFLNGLLELTTSQDPSVDYYNCVIMKNLTPTISLSNQNTISNILIHCISSKNFLVKQIAIESFAFISNIHCHDYITESVTNDHNIEYYISDYLKKIPLFASHNKIDFPKVFFHKCFISSENIFTSKKLEDNYDSQSITPLLSNLVQCVNLIKVHGKGRNLSTKEKEIINSVISDLKNL